MPASLEEQLAIYLTDAHAMELQALVQVKRARKVAGEAEIAAAFDEHVRETERHEHYVTDRLMALGWSPVPQKDMAGKVAGIGMALFARFQPDTPGGKIRDDSVSNAGRAIKQSGLPEALQCSKEHSRAGYDDLSASRADAHHFFPLRQSAACDG